MDYLNINSALLGIVGIFLAYQFVWTSLTTKDSILPKGLPFVPIQVGKSKQYVSKTNDASMYVERSRRRAIIGNHGCGKKGFWNKDSTNGSLESYFISGMCPGIGKKIGDPCFNGIIYDAGNARSEYDNILDGNYDDDIWIDLGNALTNTYETLFEGGNGQSEYQTFLEANGLLNIDLGNAYTNVCDL